MAPRKRPPLEARELSGFKYFQLLDELLVRLHDAGTERDKAGNRQLFFDQYAVLMLLYFFNPAVTSLRGLREFTTLEKVQKLCGVRPTSLGSLSEAAQVFDPQLLEPMIAQIARQALEQAPPRTAQQAALENLIAVDGTLLPALPRMSWALWQSQKKHAAKAHVAFHVVREIPVHVRVTHGNGSERNELRKLAEAGGFYVCDRGYAEYDLFRDLDAEGIQFLIRVQDHAVYDVLEEAKLSPADREAGVVRDVRLRRLGTEKHNSLLERPLRLVIVQGETPDQQWVLVTNAHGLAAELIALAYHHRWQVELFFRWLKCILGCRHLLSESESGVTLQVYFAILASLLIGLWIGAAPTRRTYEMLCHYLSGWATLDELDRHLEQRRVKATGPPEK